MRQVSECRTQNKAELGKGKEGGFFLLFTRTAPPVDGSELRRVPLATVSNLRARRPRCRQPIYGRAPLAKRSSP